MEGLRSEPRLEWRTQRMAEPQLMFGVTEMEEFAWRSAEGLSGRGLVGLGCLF